MNWYQPLFGVAFLLPSATPLKQVAHWVREGCSVRKFRQITDETGEFDGSIRKNQCFTDGTLHLYDPVHEKGRFSGREDTNKKETPSKGCLCSYLVIRFLDSLRLLEMTVGR